MCVLTYRYVHMCAGACGARKSQLAPLELYVPFVRQHLMSVLGCELGSSAKAVRALSH